MFSRLGHTLKYIFITGMMCTCMTACGNTDGYSAAQKYETEIVQETLERTPVPVTEPTMESEPEPIPTPEPTPVLEQELEEVDKTQLENEFPMPDEIKAMEMGYSQAGTIADIKDITWETVDYNVVDLHFHLEDGSAVDMEIIGYSVLDIVHEDITGDDADEVLIYCDFANNACDWQLVYFYQIDEGSVTDISPSSKDIPELKSNEGYWNTWIAAKSVEGYSSPIYKLEDYYKEWGILYTAETLYIGYKDGKWELVQEFEQSTAADFFYGGGQASDKFQRMD